MNSLGFIINKKKLKQSEIKNGTVVLTASFK